MRCEPAPVGSRRPGAAGLLAAALLFPACEGNVGEGDQPGAYTVRISEKLDGTEASMRCEHPSLSADGRFVVFSSKGTTLVPNDANGITDIFAKDRSTGEIENITLLSSGEFGPYPRENGQAVISADGRFIAFESYGNYHANGFVPSSPNLNLWRFDRLTREFRIVAPIPSWPNSSLRNPSISADGRYVAFDSSASNLVAGIDPLGQRQAWVADFAGVVNPGDAPVITLVSRATGGNTLPADAYCERPRISGDGSAIVFSASATNLHAAATGGESAVYLGTPAGAQLELVSQAALGVLLQANTGFPSVSHDGRHVAFGACGVNTVAHPTLPASGIFRYDRANDALEVAADEVINPGFALAPLDRTDISADGGRIAYAAEASPGSELFVIRVRDMRAASPVTASVHLSGVLPLLSCEKPALSADGKWVVWQTEAANLVTGDTNGVKDIYVRGPLR